MTATGLLRDDHRGSSSGTQALHFVLQAIARGGQATCVILDDLERMTGADALGQLDTLIRYAPDHVHIALAARSNPGLSLAHLSLMGLVNHIDAGSLRFTATETSAYLEGTVSAHDMRAFTDQTEGWPVALQILRALSARQQRSSHAAQSSLPGASRPRISQSSSSAGSGRSTTRPCRSRSICWMPGPASSWRTGVSTSGART